ncbi:MAG TPA: TatD family hydrolase [Bacteroidia bacterium]|nr:TatD family hydrolase [Bacteroidia bacterium]
MFVDTHTHLYSEEFTAEIDVVLKKAIDAGVEKFFLPNIDSSSIDAMHALSEKYPQHCFPMMGLHPCSVKEDYKEELAIAYNYLQTKKYVAIGEIGIDLYWDKTFYTQQVEAFEQQINWALEFNLPIVIHCRNSFDEIYEVLCGFKKLPRGIFHCFSGNAEQAQKIIDKTNFKLGIGGVITFKNSGLDKAIENIDLKHLVLETDSPYLAPVPYRGKRNESAYIPLIAAKIADVKKCSLLEVATLTTANAKEIFGWV